MGSGLAAECACRAPCMERAVGRAAFLMADIPALRGTFIPGCRLREALAPPVRHQGKPRTLSELGVSFCMPSWPNLPALAASCTRITSHGGETSRTVPSMLLFTACKERSDLQACTA